MNFNELAQKAQQDLDIEKNKLVKKEADLNIKASAIMAREAKVVEKEAEQSLKDRELQAREEEVSRRELNMRKDEQIQADLLSAEQHHKKASEELKLATEYRDEANQKLKDLERREINLSESKKTYKQELELEVMRNFTFRK